MEKVFSPLEIQRLALGWKKKYCIGLVPTMGCLHEGHLSLIRRAKKQCDRVILTVFVNPMQFGPNEDLDSYPRQFELDCDMAEKEGVDVVFAPQSEKMYSENFQTSIAVKHLSKGLCGADRPGHFEGVATVVAKLFNLTCPDVAIFGEKDFQQLAVLRRMTEDLNFPVEIIGAPIVRESDGLAMSSRNKYLYGDSRQKALCLSHSIATAKRIVKEALESVDAGYLVSIVKEEIQTAGADLDYAVIVDESTLKDETVVTPNSRIAIAAKIDQRVRLIDNANLMGS